MENCFDWGKLVVMFEGNKMTGTTSKRQLIYAKGYAAGQRRSWPEHKPPRPPDAIVSELQEALQQLRDDIDGELAKFDEDDELNIVLSPSIERADEALRSVTKWLLDSE